MLTTSHRIASRGVDEYLAELHMHQAGTSIVLSLWMIDYDERSGWTDEDKVAVQIARSIDEAMICAEDLEQLAYDLLDGRGCLGSRPALSFSEAVEQVLTVKPSIAAE